MVFAIVKMVPDMPMPVLYLPLEGLLGEVATGSAGNAISLVRGGLASDGVKVLSGAMANAIAP